MAFICNVKLVNELRNTAMLQGTRLLWADSH